jgi:phosphocarrier protein
MSGGQQTPVQRRFEIKNRLGLHARAAALLVQTLAGFDAEIIVTKDGVDVNGKSILGLMTLGAGQGSLIEVLKCSPRGRMPMPP